MLLQHSRFLFTFAESEVAATQFRWETFLQQSYGIDASSDSTTLHEANLHVGFCGLEVHMYSEHQTDSPLICSPMSLPRSQQTNGKMANEASFQ